jgi:hypothetical protein
MSTRNDYSAEEWKAISAAPLAVGLVMVFSEPRRPAAVGDGAADVGRAISRSTFRDAPEIAKVLAELAKTQGGRADLAGLPTGSRARTQDTLIAIVGTAVRAVETKSPGEVEPFKTWLASVAAKVLHSTKKPGAAPVNGAPVEGDEQDTIDRLADVLAARATSFGGTSPAGKLRSRRRRGEFARCGSRPSQATSEPG